PVFTKKKNAMLAQQIEILDWYHKNSQNQTATAKHFAPKYPNLQLKQPLVSCWVKDKVKWHEQWEQVNKKSNCNAKQTRQTKHPEVSEMMDLWVS
ncbi:hypothetical protein BYT27DRAFT_7023697, partial [Phlegmacium glaucopus]